MQKPNAQVQKTILLMLASVGLLAAAFGGWTWWSRSHTLPNVPRPTVMAQPPHISTAAPALPPVSAASAPKALPKVLPQRVEQAPAQDQPGRAGAPVFVLNSLDATISVMDATNYVEIKRIPTGKQPHHFYLTPDERSLIVANSVSDSLTLIDPITAEVQRTISGIIDPYQLRFSPDMKWFVTAANRLNHVDIYRWQPQDAAEPLKLAARIPASKTPSHLSIDQQSRYAYVSLQESDELMAIDLATQKPLWRIPVGRMPADVYLTPDGQHLLLGMTGDEVVEVYDISQTATQAAKLVKRIPTGAGAHAFRSAGDGRHVFVSNRVANTVSKLDVVKLEVVESYPAPGGPDCMDVLADGKTLLLTSRWSRQLTVIDTTTKQVAQQVAVGRSPHGVWTLNHASRL
jgi:YVTN family beta-propeller protein